MKIVFVNGSPNKNGNTAQMAKELLKGHDFETINLVDYRIVFFGQNSADDELDKVVEILKKADTIIIGSPVYWHNICGSIRTLLDRFYDLADEGILMDKNLYFIYQGAAPGKWMLEAGEYTIKRFASLYGMHYRGMITNLKEAKELAETL